MQAVVNGGDAVERGLRQFDGRDLALAQEVCRLVHRQAQKIVGHALLFQHSAHAEIAVLARRCVGEDVVGAEAGRRIVRAQHVV